MKDNNFQILIRAKNLNKYLRKDLVNFRKDQRYLKIRILNTSYDLVENIITANLYDVKYRENYYKNMIKNISLLDFYLEEIYEDNLLNKKRFDNYNHQLADLKNMIYGWIKSSKV